MSKPDNFQLQSAQALRQLAIAVERGTVLVIAVNADLLDGRLNLAIHAVGTPAEIRPRTITDWGILKFLCNRLPPLQE